MTDIPQHQQQKRAGRPHGHRRRRRLFLCRRPLRRRRHLGLHHPRRVAHRLSCSFNGASGCRPAALALSWSGCPTAARDGGGNAVMKNARASAKRAQILSSSPPGHGPTCRRASTAFLSPPGGGVDERRSLLSDAVPSESFSFEARRRSRASGKRAPGGRSIEPVL